MKNLSLYLTFLFVAVMCCSMSKCDNRTPGTATSVHGTVTDFNTGQPIANAKLIVEQDVTNGDVSSFIGGIFSGQSHHEYSYYDTISTKADGSYKYEFTPTDAGDCQLNLIFTANYLRKYGHVDTVKTGRDNSISLKLQKLVNLKLHVVNNSSHGADKFSLSLSGCCFIIDNEYFGIGLPIKVRDTIFSTKIPTKSVMKLTSNFYTLDSRGNALVYTYNPSPYTFNSGFNNTTVTVINP